MALVALVVLVVNDTVLKQALPGVMTGKLSDMSGLVVAPLVVATVLAMVGLQPRDAIRGAIIGVGTWFTAMKLVGSVAAMTEVLAEAVVPQATIVVDPTDLVALPALAVAQWVWHHPLAARTAAVPVLVVAAFWSVATSCAPIASSDHVVMADDGSFMVDLEGELRRVSPGGSLEAPVLPDSARTQLDGADHAYEACLADGTCVRADNHDVVETSPAGATQRVVDIPESRLAHVDAGPGHCGETPNRGVQDVAANDAQVVVVAHGHHGVSIRAADGSWTRHGPTYVGEDIDRRTGLAVVAVVLIGWLLCVVPTWGGAALTWGLATGATGIGGWLMLQDSLLSSTPVAVAMIMFGGIVALGMTFRLSVFDARHAILQALSFAATAAAALGIWLAWVEGWIVSTGIATILVGVMVTAVTLAWAKRGLDEGHVPVRRL